MDPKTREWIYIAQVIGNFLALGILISFLVLAFTGTSRRAAEQREQALRVTCSNARTQTNVLAALDDITRSLGIPVHFTIPEVPSECDDH